MTNCVIETAFTLAADSEVKAAIRRQIAKNGLRGETLSANQKTILKMTPDEKEVWLAKRRAFQAKYRTQARMRK